MRNFLVTLLLFATAPLAAQDIVRHVGEFPESRYRGGPSAFYKTLGSTLNYPNRAHRTARVGTSIVSLTLSPEGTFAQMEIINPLGKGIDEDILQTFQKTEDQWLPQPGAGPIRMYFVITYMINNWSFYRLAPDSAIFQDELIVRAVRRGHSLQRAHKKLINKLHKLQENKKFKKALKIADELIRRDPLNSQWYLQRSSINDALGNRAAVCQDLTKLRHFLKVPVTDALLLQYCD